MPNIRAQRVSPTELYIQASDGREFTATRAQLLQIYNTQGGNAAARKAATLTNIKNQIIAALGAEQISAAELTLDFSPTDENVPISSSWGPG